MVGLVPTIHDLFGLGSGREPTKEDVDGRDKHDHDDRVKGAFPASPGVPSEHAS
jgi:hypothetical protein